MDDGWDITTTTYVIGDDVLAQASSDNIGLPWATHYAPKYLFYDGHGSTRQLSDSSGDLITNESYSYDAYGVLLGGERATQTDLLYTGEQFDVDAQMYYLRARFYDPLNGRFNRADPYAGNNFDPQSLHKYNYAHNNPVNRIDPSGEFSIGLVSIMVLVIASVMAAITGVWSAAIISAATTKDCGIWIYAASRGPNSSKRWRYIRESGYQYAYKIEEFPGNLRSVYQKTRENNCDCFRRLWVMDHSARVHGVSGISGLQQGWSIYGLGQYLNAAKMMKLCPFLCKRTTLRLRGCHIGLHNVRSDFDNLFNACQNIREIRACRGETTYPDGKCEFGWRTYGR